MKCKYMLYVCILIVLTTLLFSTVSFGSDEVYSGTISTLQINDVYAGRVTPLYIQVDSSENNLGLAIKSCEKIPCRESGSFDSQDTVYFLINIKNLKVAENNYEFVLETAYSNDEGIIYESSEIISNNVGTSEAINVEVIKEFFLNNNPPGEYEFSVKVTDKNSGQESIIAEDINIHT